mgnify:CR=1 FL=1
MLGHRRARRRIALGLWFALTVGLGVLYFVNPELIDPVTLARALRQAGPLVLIGYVLVSVLRSDGRGGHGAAENVLIQLQEAAGAGSPLPAPGQPGGRPGSGQGRFYHAVDDER